MGLGKTVSTLTAVEELMINRLEVSKVLVIAPKRVAESVWDEEIQKWDHLKHLTVSKITGDEKKRVRALQTQANIYTIGRDNIVWLREFYGSKRMPFDMLVIDELSSFKNPKSQRFKALRLLQPQFKRVVGLTGTPAPNGFMDLWAQIYLLDRGQRLGKFITNYRDKYFRPDKTNGHIVYSYALLPGAEEAIQKTISDICVSMKAKDYLKLPGRIDNSIQVEMSAELKKKYKDFEKEQILNIFTPKDGEVEISALNAAALTNKLLQFANGAIYDEDGTVHHIHDLKIDATKELVEDANGKPVLIAWTYRHDRDRLMEALKSYKPRELKNSKDISDWNNNKIQVLLMHPASGGHGLNLQAGGHIIIWFGQTWSLELEQQFNARLDRQGQKETVIVNKIVTKGTVDTQVILSQNNKSRTQEALMESVKAKVSQYFKLAK